MIQPIISTIWSSFFRCAFFFTCLQPQQQQPPPPQPQQQSSVYQLQQPQLCVMNQLKEQLEERTRILQADIKTQQQELHDIKEKLHLANLQVTYPQTLKMKKQKGMCF